MALSIALNVLDHLGFAVATHKTEGPSHCITFLGIVIDTKAFELQLPADKVQQLQGLVKSWCTKRSCTKKELETLLGHLSHAAMVVHPGRSFLRQLFGLLHITKATNHYVRLTAGTRADLAWWKCFLQGWNGSSFFPLLSPSHHVYSDALGMYGCGAVVVSVGYFQIEWSNGWEGVDIPVKEFVAVVVAGSSHSLSLRQCGSCVNFEHEDIQGTTAYALIMHFIAVMFHACMYLGQSTRQLMHCPAITCHCFTLLSHRPVSMPSQQLWWNS